LDILETEHFLIFCPATSEWPDEVWIAPKQNGGGFGMIKDAEITDLSFVLSRLVGIFDLRHGHEFPFNFYIPPLKNWYLRLIPRGKVIGGFELGTNIMVNTQDPAETFNFINEHFWKPDREKIKSQHLAEYGKKV
jgi:UDPglucose--hexose-1-phosphate uridylyltransferase